MLTKQNQTQEYPLATRLLIACGAIGPLLFVIVLLIEGATRPGYSAWRHFVSSLSLGPQGWVQIANFVVSGGLVLAGAIGIRHALRGHAAGTWAPPLLAVYGLGLIGAGLFVADPSDGFPPGSPPFHGLSRSGMLHFVFGGIGFFAVIAACFVFARRFGLAQRQGFAWWSAMTGAFFSASFAAVASGAKSPLVMLTFYASVVWLWIWHAAVHARVRAEAGATCS